MEQLNKKRAMHFSFSYIDIFFVLLAGLILSFGIGFLVEIHRENLVESYYVYLSAEVEEEFFHAIPVAGDTVFDADGSARGKVLTVETREDGDSMYLTVKCRISEESLVLGEEILLETPGSMRLMRVDSLEKTEQKGW